MKNQFLQASLSRDINWFTYLLWIYIAGLFLTHLLLQFAVVILILILIYLLLKGESIPAGPIHYLVIGYFFSGLLAFIISNRQMEEIAALFPHLVVLSFVPISMLFRRTKSISLPYWIRGITILATLTALMGIYHHLSGEQRASGFFGGYFTLASLMVWSIPLTTGYFLYHRQKRSLLYAVSLFLQILALWWTFTRSAMFALYLGIGVWSLYQLIQIFSGQLKRKQILVNWAVIWFLLSYLAVSTVTSEDPRINPFAERESAELQNFDFTSGRGDIIGDARSIISGDVSEQNYVRLLFGHGLSSRNRLVESKFTSWESDYLQVFMDQGLIGLLLLVLLYGSFIMRLRRGLSRPNFLKNSLAAAGIVFMVMSFFTLKLTSWHSAPIFCLIYIFLDQVKTGEQEKTWDKRKR